MCCKRWWYRGEHCCLPSSRPGFDSRPSQLTFFRDDNEPKIEPGIFCFQSINDRRQTQYPLRHRPLFIKKNYLGYTLVINSGKMQFNCKQNVFICQKKLLILCGFIIKSNINCVNSKGLLVLQLQGKVHFQYRCIENL